MSIELNKRKGVSESNPEETKLSYNIENISYGAQHPQTETEKKME